MRNKRTNALPIELPAHATIHRGIGKTIGFLVLMAKGMADLEGRKLANLLSGLFKERAQDRTLDLILALDLLHHQLRVGNDTKPAMAVGHCKLEYGEQTGVFSEVVGLVPKEFRQFRNYGAVRGLNDRSEACWTGIAAGAAIAVGRDPAGIVAGGRRSRRKKAGSRRSDWHKSSLPCGRRLPFPRVQGLLLWNHFLTPESVHECKCFEP
jgi:hypothetical protein